jgi:hypothetical protein
VRHRSGQPIELGDDENVARADELQRGGELTAMVADAGHLLAEHPLAIGQVAQLRFQAGLLLDGRGAGIADQHVRCSCPNGV